MNPRPSSDNPANCKRGDIEHLRQINLGHSVIVKFSYFLNLGLRKLRLIVARSPGEPRFRSCVLHVVGVCSKKQVIWIDALSNIASMAHAHSFWNIPKMKLPRYSVGEKWFFEFVACHCAVTARLDVSRPNPTPIGFFNLFPKGLRYGFNSVRPFFFHAQNNNCIT